MPIPYAMANSPGVAPPPPASPEDEEAARERLAEAGRETAKQREQRIEELAALQDPVARLLGALWSFSEYTPPRQLDAFAPPRQLGAPMDATIFCDEEALRHLLPSLFQPGRSISLGTNPPWNSHEIAAWFLRHPSRGSPPSAALRFERKRLIGYKEVRRSGWGFPHGSTFWVDRVDGGDFLAASLSIDGEVVVGSVASQQGGDGLNASALQVLAQACELARAYVPKEIPPSVGRPYDANELQRMVEQMKAKMGPTIERYRTTAWVAAT